MKQPLPRSFRNLRVLDLSTDIAGPYCAKLLRDAGATVIKVESPDGDPLRRWRASGEPLPPGEDGALFQFLNGGKRSVVVDFTTQSGHAALLRLAATADLAIESFGADGIPGMGPAWTALATARPSLSVVSISPWGVDGPCAARPATEWTLQAEAGITMRRGHPARYPLGLAGRIGEWITGSYASFGALSAWLSSRRTGRGQHVDVSIFENLLICGTQYHMLGGQFHDFLMPQYIDSPALEPAKDGWVGFSTITAQQWQDFCGMIGHPQLFENEAFRTADGRMAELESVKAMIHGWTLERTVDEIVEIASALRIPVSPVGSGASLQSIDHFVERGVFVPHPGGFVQPRVPYHLSAIEKTAPAAAPALGEHPEEIPGEDAAAVPVPAPTHPSSPLPFTGLKVLDLTAFWAGPFLTNHFAAMGAEVIKIESTHRPDGMRFVNVIQNDVFWECGSIFHGVNPGKRGITLKLDDPEAKEIFLRLLDQADILVENFSVRVLPNLGLDPEDLRRRNPSLIVVRMPSWGLDGPWRDRVGFAMNVEQASGLAWRSGYEDLPTSINACDPVGALHAAIGITIALEHRAETGEGQLIEVPLVEPALNLSAELLIEKSAYDFEIPRLGNRTPNVAPQGAYRCAGDDQWLALAIPDDEAWVALSQVLGAPGWATAPNLSSVAGRYAAHDEIDRHLSDFFASRDARETVETLGAAGIPASYLENAHAVVPHAQLDHREFLQEIEHPIVGRRRYPRLPMTFSGMDVDHRLPPPTLGQHNDEILGGELGISDEKRADLRERKIIGERPAWL